jgi:hypothetical protein
VSAYAFKHTAGCPISRVLCEKWGSSHYFTVSPTLVTCVYDAPVTVTVKLELPVEVPDPLVNVSVDDPLPGEAKFAALKLPVIPLGSPDTENATEDLNPPKAAVVTFTVPFAVELTVTLVALGVTEKPGTFTVKVCFCVTPPPAALTETE